MDEFGPSTCNPTPATSGRRPPSAPATGARRRRRGPHHRPHGSGTCWLATTCLTDRLYGHVKNRKTRVEFLAFCRYHAPSPAHADRDRPGQLQPHLTTKTDSRVGDWAAANNVELAYVPFYGSWLNRIEAQFTALRYFALDGTDHASHQEQASMIRRYILWRNTHATDPKLRKVIKRAATIKRAKVA